MTQASEQMQPADAGPVERPVGRLSEKQLWLLEQVRGHETPTDDFKGGLPLYVSHTFMHLEFDTEGERRRFFENLERRGLISRSGPGGCFVRLTDRGRTVCSKTPNRA